MKRKPDAKQLLELLVDMAPQLRRAGVLRLAIDGFSAELAPAPKPAPKIERPEPPDSRDALNDPATYGIRDPKAKLPGLHLE